MATQKTESEFVEAMAAILAKASVEFPLSFKNTVSLFNKDDLN